MHKSRIGAIFIDQPPSTFAASVAFWAAAMGRVPDEGRAPHPPYISLGRYQGELAVDLQRLDDESPARLHLDVDTDDVEAEVSRLEALGATRVKQFDGYWQMVDPGGMVFCVIPPHTPDFAEHATTWDDD
jgi:glyoxalase superfamily protein